MDPPDEFESCGKIITYHMAQQQIHNLLYAWDNIQKLTMGSIYFVGHF
jgi:hypothetical protein